MSSAISIRQWSFFTFIFALLLGPSSLLAQGDQVKIDYKIRNGEFAKLAGWYNDWYTARKKDQEATTDNAFKALNKNGSDFFYDNVLEQLRAVYPNIPADPAIFVGVPYNPTATPVVSFMVHAKGASSTDALITMVQLTVNRKDGEVDSFSHYTKAFRNAGAAKAKPANDEVKDLKIDIQASELHRLADHYGTWYAAKKGEHVENTQTAVKELRAFATPFFKEQVLEQLQKQYPQIPAEPAIFVGIPNFAKPSTTLSFNVSAKGAKASGPAVASIHVAIQMKDGKAESYTVQGIFHTK